MYMHGDLKITNCETTDEQRELTSKWYITVTGATKLSREFMLVSHKSFELGLKCCFMNMMKWPFKVLSEELTLQGLLRTHSAALYHPRRREKRGPKRNRKGTQEIENILKPKCKRVIAAEMSKEALTKKKEKKKKPKMKERRARKTFILR